MSFTEPADGAQPTGQGDGGESGGQPYADYLTRVPEEVRGDIEPIFKDWNSNVNSRFQEHAEYKKSWEPYEQSGVRNLTPEEVQWTMQLRQAALENPAALREWLDSTHGPMTVEQPAEQTFDQFGDPQQQLQQMLEQKLGPLQQQFEQFMTKQQQMEQQAQEANLAEQISQEIGKLKAEHAKDLPEKVQEQIEDIIERFGMKYATQPGATPASVVQQAWADFEALSNQLQTGALQGKVNQPDPTLSGDVADVAPPVYTKGNALKEAEKVALEQMRANKAA